jgi:hypothetical protein
MILAFAAALTLTVFVLAELGAGQQGTTVALQATARLSFLLFWPAYAGGALTALFGSAFQPLKQRTREFGLAFASAHLVHIGLVGWLCHIGAAPSLRSFIFFGIAVVWTYLLALFSIGQLQTALGPNGWWVLRVVGLNYIAYAFAVDFLKHPLFGSLGHTVAYLPFAAFSVVGPMLRLAAFLQRTGHRLAETGRRAGSRSRDPEELMRSATARD